MPRTRSRVEFGDWQTPLALASDVFRLLRAQSEPPACVLEPTCGNGAFLQAAAATFPQAQLYGFEIDEEHAATAKQRLVSTSATITHADFFDCDWDAIVAAMPEPIWIVGNPPWVTNAGVGALGGQNLPKKINPKGTRGIDARTGKSNFDISLWMLQRLLTAVASKRFCMAVLCKSIVARQVLKEVSANPVAVYAALYTIDAKEQFDAAVDAVLLVIRTEVTGEQGSELVWPVFADLKAVRPHKFFGMLDGAICSDVDSAKATQALAGPSDVVWRSGLKHDCAKVMEFHAYEGQWQNAMEQAPQLQDEACWYPLLKGSHVAAGRPPQHRVLVTQPKPGVDTNTLEQTAPKTWAYLQEHAPAFARRKSSIYKGQPKFAIFGVGEYSFAPYKVAICGLYKRLRFCVVPPFEGKPVMLDDTCYFLPCNTLAQAELLADACNSPLAQKFLGARVFWDMKRPVSKALLSMLSLPKLLQALGKFGDRSV